MFRAREETIGYNTTYVADGGPLPSTNPVMMKHNILSLVYNKNKHREQCTATLICWQILHVILVFFFPNITDDLAVYMNKKINYCHAKINVPVHKLYSHFTLWSTLENKSRPPVDRIGNCIRACENSRG